MQPLGQIPCTIVSQPDSLLNLLHLHPPLINELFCSWPWSMGILEKLHKIFLTVLSEIAHKYVDASQEVHLGHVYARVTNAHS